MITYDNLQLLKKYAKDSDTILLLGSQEMNIAECQAHEKVFARDWLIDNGFYSVTDVDNNGKAECNFDLSKFNPDEFGGFDLIADFGTTEHVSDPVNCIRNVIAWLPVGGTAIFVNPSPEYIDEVNHKGCPRFTDYFWDKFAELTNMEVLLLDTKRAYEHAATAIETRVVLRKTKDSVLPAKRSITNLFKEYCQI